MIISLCSGYGGLDRAVSAAFGLPIGAHAEPEKISVKKGKLVPNPVLTVLERRFPGVPNLGDIRETDWGLWRGLCKVLCAGFPCQPVSAAGRQLAEDDERWLWPSVHRAALELAPEWIVLENVANIVSIQGGRIWAMILEHLREMGYDVAWGIFGACLVGACHHRHRMFLAARRGTGRPAHRWGGKACGLSRGAGLPTPRASHALGQSRDHNNRGEPGLLSVTAMFPTPTARDWRGRGPTPVAKDAESCAPTEFERNSLALRAQVLDFLRTPSARDGDQRGQGSVEHMERRMESGHTINLGDQLRLLPTPRATDGTNGGPGQRGSSGDLAMPSAVQAVNFGRFGASVEHWAGIHGAPPAPTEIGPQGGVKMSPRFPEWMMGLAPGYVTDVLPRNDALRAIGNGVMPQQGYHAIRVLLDMLSGAPLG